MSHAIVGLVLLLVSFWLGKKYGGREAEYFKGIAAEFSSKLSLAKNTLFEASAKEEGLASAEAKRILKWL